MEHSIHVGIGEIDEVFWFIWDHLCLVDLPLFPKSLDLILDLQ